MSFPRDGNYRFTVDMTDKFHQLTEEDPHQLFQGIHEGAIGTSEWAFAEHMAANIVGPNSDYYDMSNYTSASVATAVTLHAFKTSDANAGMIKASLEVLTTSKLFIFSDKTKRDERVAALELFADYGHTAHPEFTPLCEALVDYIEDTAHTSEALRCGRVAAGLTLYLADKSWDRVLENTMLDIDGEE